MGDPADPVGAGPIRRDGRRLRRRLPAKARHAGGIGTQRALGRAIGRQVALDLARRGVDPDSPTYDTQATWIRDRYPLVYDFVVVPNESLADTLRDAWDAAFWRAVHADRGRWHWMRKQVLAAGQARRTGVPAD